MFIFSCFGILLVVLAAINYMNLSTALASKRAKEVGIRKTLGSPRSIIALQFLSESFILILISTLVALMAVQLILPSFQQQFNIELPNPFEIHPCGLHSSDLLHFVNISFGNVSSVFVVIV